MLRAAVAPRVLVVDDDPLALRALARRLRGEFDVFVSASVEDALARVASGERFDAILTDLLFEGALSGRDLYERLLEIDPAQAARTLFVTGLEPDPENDFDRRELHRFVSKVADREVLVAQVRRLSAALRRHEHGHARCS